MRSWELTWDVLICIEFRGREDDDAFIGSCDEMSDEESVECVRTTADGDGKRTSSSLISFAGALMVAI